MNVEEMSAEQLMALAQEKAGDAPAASIRTVEVEGLVVQVDDAKTKSWPAFRILSGVVGDVTPESIESMMGFIALVTDVNEKTIVEHCGGDTASFEDVLRVASAIIGACYPKH